MEAGVKSELASTELVAALLSDVLQWHCVLWDKIDDQICLPASAEDRKRWQEQQKRHEARIIAALDIAKSYRIELTEAQEKLLPIHIYAEMRYGGPKSTARV